LRKEAGGITQSDFCDKARSEELKQVQVMSRLSEGSRQCTVVAIDGRQRFSDKPPAIEDPDRSGRSSGNEFIASSRRKRTTREKIAGAESVSLFMENVYPGRA